MELLAKKDYHLANDYLNQVDFNVLFARSVIDHKVNGRVYVDNLQRPNVFYIVHPYGMSLLLGSCNVPRFNDKFKDYSLNTFRTRTNYEWMQVFPNDWNFILAHMYSGLIVKSSDNAEALPNAIELNTRVNFRFNYDKYISFYRTRKLDNVEVVKVNEEIYNGLNGTVIPSNFWNNVDDYLKHGIGYSILFDNKYVATAYSAFVLDRKLEIGIETLPNYRGRGFASVVCSELIGYCIENGYEPIWACRLENKESFKLASKLGFEEDKRLPYYRLSI